MAQQTINIGTTANDGTGDPARTAFGKVNDNFDELYNADTALAAADTAFGVRIEAQKTKRQWLSVSVVGDSIGVRAGSGYATLQSADTASSGKGINNTHELLGASQGFYLVSNYAVSGVDTTELLASTQLTDALADDTDIVFVSVGTNDVMAPSYTVTNTTLLANFDTIIDTILAANKICIIATISPQGGITWALEPKKLNFLLEANNHIRERAATDKNIIVLDRFNSIVDPTDSDVVPLANYLEDGTHPLAEGFLQTADDFAAEWGTELLNAQSLTPVGQATHPQMFVLETEATIGAPWTSVGTLSQQTASNDALYQPAYRIENNEANVRALPFAMSDYIVQGAFWFTSKAVIYFACSSAGTGYAARITLADGTVEIVPVTTWTTFGAAITTVAGSLVIAATANEDDSMKPYAVHIRDNRYVSVGVGAAGARDTFPILNYDMGASTLGTTNLWYGYGSTGGVVYADNLRLYTKRRKGIVSPWSAYLAGSTETTTGGSTVFPAGWSGDAPLLADATAISYRQTTKPTNEWVRKFGAITGGTVANSLVDDGDGTYTWRFTATASGAGGCSVVIYIPTIGIEPSRWYAWDIGVRMAPESGDGVAMSCYVYRDLKAGGQVIAVGGCRTTTDYVYSERTAQWRLPPFYHTQRTGGNYLTVFMNWSAAGTHVFDITNLSLSDITDLYAAITA